VAGLENAVMTCAPVARAEESIRPVRAADRALAPDLARGVMLLFIALANAAGVVFGGQPGFEPAPEGIERGLNLAMFAFVHSRAYPVFAIMFGYGLAQLAARQRDAGASVHQVRGLLLRRNAWLAALGVLHGTLLYFGDFLGAYGLVGMAAAILLVNRSARVLRAALWIWGASLVQLLVLSVVAIAGLLTSTGPPAAVPFEPVASLTATSFASSVVLRLHEWPRHTLTVLPFIMIVWLGIWAASQRILETPAAHRRMLALIATGGLGIAVAGGVPLGLVSAGWLAVDAEAVGRLFYLHQVSGMFAGAGYAALVGLVASYVREPRRPATGVIGAVAALGRCSLSAYLLQSVVWVVCLSPFTLALGQRGPSPLSMALLVATLTWLGSLALSAVLRDRGKTGPAEVWLRRRTYGGAR